MSQLTFNLVPERRVFSVSELTGRIRDLLTRNFTDILVEGEVSNCQFPQSGHMYCTLKDDRAQIKGVCFKTQLRLMKFRPENGLHVTVRGSISVYETRGEYQIYIESIEPVGLGALQLGFCGTELCRGVGDIFQAELLEGLNEVLALAKGKRQANARYTNTK